MTEPQIPKAFGGEESSTEPLGEPKWLPPKLDPISCQGQTPSYFSIYEWWHAYYMVKNPQVGFDVHLFDWHQDKWRYVHKAFGESVPEADKAMRLFARMRLLTGQVPEAESQSPELAALVQFWREHGFHGLARDNA